MKEIEEKEVTTGKDKPLKSSYKPNRRARRTSSKQGGKPIRRNERFNDVSWYKKYPTLVEAAAKLGFNHIGGYNYLGVNDGVCLVPQSNTYVDVGQVIRINYMTTPGISKDSTSGLALQMRKLYLAMKRKYRGLNTYEVADLTVTLFCIAEFYRVVAKLERIYGICNYYSARNRTMPKLLPGALNFDYNNITSHLADFRTGINNLIIRAQTLCLPTGMDILNRWFLLESNVFKDSEGERANYYVFDDMYMFYTYQPTYADKGGCAVLSNVNQNMSAAEEATYTELLDVANDMLSLLLEDDDVTLQLGDIISYFTQESGKTDLLVLQPIPEDYVVVPVYNEDIIHQIHNSVTIGDSFASTFHNNTITSANFNVGAHSTLGVHVTDGRATGLFQTGLNIPRFDLNLGNKARSEGLYFDHSAVGASKQLVWKAGNHLLDTWKDVPSEDDVIEMTRLLPWIKPIQHIVVVGGQDYIYQIFDVQACGTELIINFDIFGTEWQSAGDEMTFTTVVTNNTSNSTICLLSQFDWAPRVYVLDQFSTTAGTTYAGYSLHTYTLGDLDNARVLPASILRQLHDAVVMSLFDISSVKAFETDK